METSNSASSLGEETDPPLPALVNDSSGVVAVFGELGSGAIITEAGLAKIFGRHPASVKRAVDRGELPPPIHLMKRPIWTVGAILSHLERRLNETLQDRERAKNALDKHRR